jgi:tetratricopeptide (TPR) repeat protein
MTMKIPHACWLRRVIGGPVLIVLTLVTLPGCAATGGAGGGARADGPVATEVLAEWRRADRHYARGEFVRARASYEVVRSRQPDNQDVLFRLANIAYYLRDLEQARELYDRVIDAGMSDPQVFYNRAVLHLTQAHDDLSLHRGAVGEAEVSHEIRAVMAAIERLSMQPTANPESGTVPAEGEEAP